MVQYALRRVAADKLVPEARFRILHLWVVSPIRRCGKIPAIFRFSLLKHPIF